MAAAAPVQRGVAPPKVRRVVVDEMEIEKQEALFFDLPRKTCMEMIPEVYRWKDLKKFEQQHRFRNIKKMMKRARIPKIHESLQCLIDFDKSESIIPHGEVSKRLYYDIFHDRDFDLYARLMKKQPYDERREKELNIKAAELGVTYTRKHTFEEKQKEIVPNIFGNSVEELKRPVIASKIWDIGYATQYKPPVGFASDPGPTTNSMGNERFYAYVGSWELGKMKGFGTYQYIDGKTYTGGYHNNLQEGKGRAEYDTGASYDGEWVKGKYQGHGEWKSDGEFGATYTGNFEYGRRHNQNGVGGKLELACGLSYEGDFEDGKPHGRGKLSSKMTKWSFEGTFEKGFIKGSGALITPPPENKRIVRTWDPMMTVETDGHHAGLLLSDVVKMYLDDLVSNNNISKAQYYDLFTARRGIQLRDYVNSVRTALHDERRRVKVERHNQMVEEAREAKRKLQEARIKALLGE